MVGNERHRFWSVRDPSQDFDEDAAVKDDCSAVNGKPALLVAVGVTSSSVPVDTRVARAGAGMVIPGTVIVLWFLSRIGGTAGGGGEGEACILPTGVRGSANTLLEPESTLARR